MVFPPFILYRKVVIKMIRVEGNKISIVQHDNGILNFKLDNKDLVDGDKVYFLVKQEYSQNYYNIEIIVDTFENGEAKIFISEQDTSIEAGTYKYAICVHTVDGLISTIVSGNLKIIEGVHHELE